MSNLKTLCGICNEPEGNDPKAHVCLCLDCGLEWEDNEPNCDCESEER